MKYMFMGLALAVMGCSMGTPEISQRFSLLVEQNAPQMQVGLIRTGTSSVVAHEATRNGIETWIGPDDTALLIQNGLLVGTRGLGAGFIAADLRQVEAAMRSRHQRQVQRRHSYLTGNDQTRIDTYECLINLKGPAPLTIDGVQMATQLISEVCQHGSGTFENFYWFSGSEIIQSRQWAGEFVGMISTRNTP